MSKFGKLLLRFLESPASLKFKHLLADTSLIIPMHGRDCKKNYKELARDYIQKNKLIDYEKSSETSHYRE